MPSNCGAGKTRENPLYSKEIKWVNPKENQPWIFFERTDAEAEVPVLCPPDAKNWLLWKVPDTVKSEGRRRRGQQRVRWLDGITDSMDMNFSKLREIVKDRGAWSATVHGVAKGQTWFSNWTITKTTWFWGNLRVLGEKEENNYMNRRC